MATTNYVYGIASGSYGTPTGLATMPITPTALPGTVKGSVTIEETAGTEQKFYEDQKQTPVLVLQTEAGAITATLKFYNIDYAMLAAFKGGTAVAIAPKSYTPPVGYVSINKALILVTESGHKFTFFNASCSMRITGGLKRDELFTVELKAIPQATADGLGSWKIEDGA